MTALESQPRADQDAKPAADTKPDTNGASGRPDTGGATPRLSVVAPLYDERESVPGLIARLVSALESLDRAWEIVIVNDGSRDGSDEALRMEAQREPRIRIVNLRRNVGQTAAMMAGLDHARGEIIVTIDADLQNDPDDIPRLLEKLDEGYDVVSGWRRDRQDNSLTRTLPSRVANRLISWISGVRLHDYGCSLKAYRREVIENVRLYGEMHRFVPIYASWQGGRVAEIVVRHHRRRHGRSKYGLERVVKVVLDMIVVKFLDRHVTKPIYVFGGFGMLCVLASLLVVAYALWLKFAEGVSLIQTPLPQLAAMCFITGTMSVLMGLLAEIIVRTWFESQGMRTYIVRDLVNIDGAPTGRRPPRDGTR